MGRRVFSREFKHRFPDPEMIKGFNQQLNSAALLSDHRSRLVHCLWAKQRQDGKIQKKKMFDGTKHTYSLPTVQR